ncbi:TPA: PTS glucose transporter subunit IIABC, partial [Staphylococcus aureus]
MSNKYKEQAQDILTAVGGVENIVDATYDTKCITIHMQHTIPSTANEVKQIVDVTSVAENDAQLVIKLNGNVDEVYQQLQRLIKNANVEESENTDNINSQDTSYIPQVKVTTPILVKA